MLDKGVKKKHKEEVYTHSKISLKKNKCGNLLVLYIICQQTYEILYKIATKGDIKEEAEEKNSLLLF